MNHKSENPSHVQSVTRALTLLDILAKKNREMSLTEVAEASGWAKSTVHGLLSTLRDYHMADQSPDSGNYHLGIRLFEYGNQIARSWSIRSVSLPAMELLNQELGEMVQLATGDNGDVLYIEKLESTHLLRIVSEIGARLPMHCSSLGKVLLAYKMPSEVKWILSKKGMARWTTHTITDMHTLEKELETIRAQGYSTDDGEIMEGLRCIAAPIFDKDGRVRYAMSVSGIAGSFRGERTDHIVKSLLRAADTISRAMGYFSSGESPTD